MTFRANIEIRPIRKAFTLTEVLVVVAIIGVLAALVSGVAVRVKERAQMTRCAANLAQLGKALHLYFGSNDDFCPPYLTFPVVRNGQHLPAEAKAWRRALEAFGAKGDVWKCPNDPGLGGPAGAHPANQSEVAGVSSYETARSLVLFCDWWSDGRMRMTATQEAKGYAWDLAFSPLVPGPDYTVHGNQGNVLYLDGHVKAGTHRIAHRTDSSGL